VDFSFHPRISIIFVSTGIRWGYISPLRPTIYIIFYRLLFFEVYYF
jgi:hypothetical protein